MDPDLIAVMLTEGFKMVTALAEGAQPDQKAKMWQWWIDDMTRWRKFFKIPD